MKKFLSLTILAVMVAACSSEEPMPVTDNSAQQQGSVRVTVEEAIKIANQAAEAFDAKSARGVSRKASSAAMVDVLGTKDGRSGGIDTLLYMVNYDNKQGYAIVSASRAGETLLGIVDEGEFNALEAAENPSYSYYLANAQNYVASTLDATWGGGTGGKLPAFTELKRFVYDVIPNRLTVEWGEKYPEGMYCPNKLAGSAQVAMAQIMSYLEAPNSINLTYSGCDALGVMELNWTALKMHKQSINSYDSDSINMHMADCEVSNRVHDSLARLCRQLGDLTQAVYHEEGSWKFTMAFSDDVLVRFQELLPEKEFIPLSELEADINYELLYEHIKNGVGYMAGIDVTNYPNATSHAWVIDGAVHSGEIITRYWNDLTISGQQHTTVTDLTNYYFHFNWCYSGDNNGYFLAGVLNPSESTIPPGSVKSNNPQLSRTGYDTLVRYFIVKD